MEHIWDFDENKNFIKVGKYKVLNFKDAYKASLLLEKINMLILKTFALIKLQNIDSPEINLLLTTPFHLQEMQLPKDQGKIIFEGLNKPKNIRSTSKINIGKDGNLRAGYRLIFLQLRDSNGKLKSIESLKKLIAHELTHTALNHVKWRDNDHDNNFNSMNKIIYKHI